MGEVDHSFERLVHEVRDRYYGKYRGFVVDNTDPGKRGRVKVRVPSVLGDQESGWALPCLPFGGLVDQGLLMIPEVDAQVWVEFEEGNVNKPIWVGVFWQAASDVPEPTDSGEPTRRLVKSPSGHLLMFEDADGEEAITLRHKIGAQIEIDPQGTITATDGAGSTVTMNAEAPSIEVRDSNGNVIILDSSGAKVDDLNGNTIETAAAGITVKSTKITLNGQLVEVGGAGGEPIIKGRSFLSLFATHVHTCTAPGAPSSPPIPQGEMTTLSLKGTVA